MTSNNESLIYVGGAKSGQGIFAKSDYKKSDLILESKILRIESQQSKYTIEVAAYRHAVIDKPGIYINHSCNPNVYIQHRDDLIYFIAYRDISCDEELCYDYETTESEIVGFKHCCCASPHCRKTILGFKAKASLLLSLYPPYVFMPHLKHMDHI